MNAREYIAYLSSPAGRLALRDASKILTNPDPETDDKVLVEMVMAVGFPKWAALRIFYQCLMRFAPLVCRSCSKEYRPRSRFTIDRPWCAECMRGPRTPEEQVKHRARQLATIAEGHGKIYRKPCERCGCDFDLHKHHPDYSRPLYVIWLCVRCHAKEHKEQRFFVKQSGKAMT
jgi:hypothetical protein